MLLRPHDSIACRIDYKARIVEASKRLWVLGARIVGLYNIKNYMSWLFISVLNVTCNIQKVSADVSPDEITFGLLPVLTENRKHQRRIFTLWIK